VARDWEQGRIYLPQASCRAWSYGEADFASRRCNAAFRELLRGEVDRAERHLCSGWPLVDRVPAEIRVPVELFVRGGLAIVRAIRQQDYDVWSRRPTVSGRRKLQLFVAACAARWRRRKCGPKCPPVPVPRSGLGLYDEGHEHGP